MCMELSGALWGLSLLLGPPSQGRFMRPLSSAFRPCLRALLPLPSAAAHFQNAPGVSLEAESPSFCYTPLPLVPWCSAACGAWSEHSPTLSGKQP